MLCPGFFEKDVITEKSEFNFGVACLLISAFTSGQLQSAEKSLNPDFYLGPNLGSFWVSNPEFQTQNRTFLVYFNRSIVELSRKLTK